jgi:hypothetical protein
VLRRLITTLAIGLLPVAASAQTAAALDVSPAEQPSQGPMIVERVHNGFLAAPEFKFTQIDHRSSGLAGGYAGVVIDDHFLVGGGAYVLTTDRRGRDLAYGGLVLQWLGGNDTFGFAAKTLIGGGSAESFGVAAPGRFPTEPFPSHRGFVVAEPEIDATVRVAPHVRVAVGAGYRFTGSVRGRRNGFFDGYRDGLNGATGTIGLQISSGR